MIYGVVIYTGHSTKIMKNAKNPIVKSSNIMRVMNNLLTSVFIFQFFLCKTFLKTKKNNFPRFQKILNKNIFIEIFY